MPWFCVGSLEEGIKVMSHVQPPVKCKTLQENSLRLSITKIEQTESFKYPGMEIYIYLSFFKHSDSIHKKGQQRLHPLRKLMSEKKF